MCFGQWGNIVIVNIPVAVKVFFQNKEGKHSKLISAQKAERGNLSIITQNSYQINYDIEITLSFTSISYKEHNILITKFYP